MDITGVMPGAAGDEEHVVGDAVGQGELALGLREVDDLLRAGLGGEEPRDAAPLGCVRVGPERDGEPLTRPRLRAGDREHPGGAPGAAELHAELDVLAGAVTLPGAGGLEGDGRDRRVAGDVDLAGDVDDAGTDVVGGPHRVDLFEVPVDAVR
jgi:hypothetical protein